ncbi:MAG: HD-GYP domain-containing protein [Cellvibrionaceae bacterium]
MSVKKEQIAVGELAVGMYVSELDRPWLETPFLMQGFLIESDDDIKALTEHCKFVFVDRQLSRDVQFHKPDAVVAEFTPKKTIPKKEPPRQNTREQKVVKLLGNRIRQPYRDTVHWRSEMTAAKRAVTGLTEEIKNLFDGLRQGSGLNFSKIKQAVGPLVSSIERNPDACIWLARLKNQDSYIYKHSVASSIWAVALGRELGLPPQDLKSLGLGALLLDIGKLKLPTDLLHKTEALTDNEFQLIRSHVNYSLAALEQSKLLNRDIWDMVACHHERYDGTGYPRGLKNDEIPLFGHIAGIVDSYDAMTSERPYGKAVSPSSAIKQLYQARDKHFDAVLVEEFIQAVGLYPAGTLVLLSSGEVAIVLAEGRTRRLKPQILLLLDQNKQALPDLKIVNMLDASCASTGAPLEIVQSLEPGSYGVDPERIVFQPAL